MPRSPRPLVFILLCLLAQGCASSGPISRRDEKLLPGWKRVQRAAIDSASSPNVWIPLLAAAVLQVDDMDGRLSDWAIEHTPIFGSLTRAEDFSGTADHFAHALYLGSLIGTPCEGGVRECTRTKGIALSVALAGNLVQQNVVSATKDAVGRARPISGSDQSFPSSAATDIAFTGELTRGNLGSTRMPTRARQLTNGGIYALETASAWSRVEAGAHFPSDVLVGLAFGHFLASFINEAFLHETLPSGLSITGGPPGTFGIGIRYEFTPRAREADARERVPPRWRTRPRGTAHTPGR